MREYLYILKLDIGTEILKTRNTAVLWLTVLFPFGSVMLASLFLFAQKSQITPDMVTFINNFNGMVAFFLPFYSVLMVSYFCQLEHRNSMLKHLFALPIPKWAFYYGKLTTSLIMLFIAGLLMLILVYISLFILGFLKPMVQITDKFEHTYLLLMVSRTFLSSVALTVIQYLISMKLRNVVVAVSIGISMIILPVAILFVLGITGLITNPGIFKWLPRYDPYSFPYSFVFNITNGGQVKQEFLSSILIMWLIIAIILAIAGYFEIKKRNIR
jgi:lantibiotic transport system permease protein